MEDERLPYISRFSLELREDVFNSMLPMNCYYGRVEGNEIYVVSNGKSGEYEVDEVGTNGAVLATYEIIRTLNPDVIVNGGTCGGFEREGMEVGMVVACERAVFHDRRIPLPGFDKMGVGEKPLFLPEGMVEEVGLEVGVVSTGNSLDCSSEDEERMVESGARVKDMECAAIAWTCSLSQTPLIAIKSVTDIVDGPKSTSEEFLANLQLASTNLADALEKVVVFICKNGIN